MSTDAPDAPPSSRPPTSTDAAGTETKAPSGAAANEGSVKETIESILIAFILAFIFRAFVVEAFVIPTGSMAPTLMGAHMRFTCTDCGYRFEANYSSAEDSGGSDVNIPATAEGLVYAAHCPNCGLQVPRVLDPNGVAQARADDDVQRGDPDNDATAPPVHYGDRILVLKYVYELFGPKRWDVVVFKTPDRRAPGQASPEPPYTINYIKRLIGRPNESIMILDGDIYVRAKGSEDWVVQTKPRVAQEALWRIVYDNDFLPRRDGWRQPWRVEDADAGGWKVGTSTERSRDLTFDRTDPGTSWLTFDPDPAQANQPLKDWLAYADTRDQGVRGLPDSFSRGGLVAQNNVGDLKLQLFYERAGTGGGPLRLELSKIDDTFTAEIGPDTVRLLHRRGPEPDVEVSPAVPLAGKSGPMRIEFTNADYQVALRIDGKELFRTTPAQYGPDIGFLRRMHDAGRAVPGGRVRIGAEAQSCKLSHVSLWRDVYYTNTGVSFGTPENPIVLGEKEYWVLGDNSLMSGDGRYWSYPIELPHEDLNVKAGRVPERFLLGKAFFVYWPAGYRVTPGGPGFIPNFGAMRFIH